MATVTEGQDNTQTQSSSTPGASTANQAGTGNTAGASSSVAPTLNSTNQVGTNQSNPVGMPVNNKVGTGFTNLQSIINANKTNQLGNTIQTGINQTAGQVQNNLNTAQQNFNTGVTNNTYSSNDQSNVNNILNNAVSNPSDLTGSDYSNFSNYLTGTYAGPQGLNDADNLQNQANNVEQLGQETGNNSGRKDLLQRFAGGNNYTAGQQRLDSLILGQTGADQLKQARQTTTGLGSQTAQDISGAQGAAATAAANNQQFGVQTQNALDQTNQGFYGTLDNQMTTANNANLAAYNSLVQNLGNNGLTVQQFNALNNLLGGNNGQGQGVGVYNGTDQASYVDPTLAAYNPQIASLYSLSPTQLGGDLAAGVNNLSNTATQNQLSSYNALSQLSGGNGLGYTLDPTQIGNQVQQIGAATSAQDTINGIQAANNGTYEFGTGGVGAMINGTQAAPVNYFGRLSTDAALQPSLNGITSQTGYSGYFQNGSSPTVTEYNLTPQNLATLNQLNNTPWLTSQQAIDPNYQAHTSYSSGDPNQQQEKQDTAGFLANNLPGLLASSNATSTPSSVGYDLQFGNGSNPFYEGAQLDSDDTSEEEQALNNLRNTTGLGAGGTSLYALLSQAAQQQMANATPPAEYTEGGTFDPTGGGGVHIR